MTIKYENRIGTELADVVSQALGNRGIVGFKVEYGDQPVTVDDRGAKVILRKTAEALIGTPHRYDFVDDSEFLQHEEAYLIELTYEITTVKRRDPQSDTLDTITAADALQTLAAWFLSAKGLRVMRDLGYSVLPVKHLRQVYTQDEQGHYELTPAFDLTLSIRQSYRDPVTVIEDKSFTIIPI